MGARARSGKLISERMAEMPPADFADMLRSAMNA